MLWSLCFVVSLFSAVAKITLIPTYSASLSVSGMEGMIGSFRPIKPIRSLLLN